VKLFEGIGKGCGDVGSRFAVQPVDLDKAGTCSCVSERAFKVSSGLDVVVGALPTGSVPSCHCQPSESGVVLITFGFASTRWLRSPALPLPSAPGT
jgi:hypothetical protein